ncbi:16S rRNA (cytosine(1402)-N(4))-methyltransferase [Candidatus Saccharibacteria bacterium]|nr:MAG: 16S rRNA (cytosine(1402)-N(4))-methyltransferase [Candidatus Saccharibacteria bacterium]
MSKTPPQQLHQPVLLKQTVHVLSPLVGESYLDLTAGYGGHASEVIAITKNAKGAVLVDRDENAIRELQPLAQSGAQLLHTNFAQATEQLVASGAAFDMVLVDLGVSSPQLDRSERGFSFRNDGPLDMRMDQREEFSASDIVNRFPVDEIARIIHQYGEEPRGKARRIALAIAQARPLSTTGQLAAVIEREHRGPRSKKHPATRTFQALRIAVNRELEQVEQMLQRIPRLLNPGGRVAIISFHSLEDRLVKRFFSEQAEAGYEAELQILTKKPISGATEDVHNPRARSAMLRAAVKIKTRKA